MGATSNKKMRISCGEQGCVIQPSLTGNLPIWSWGFAIGSAITILYAEWKAGKS